MKHLKPIIFAMGVFFISFINDTLVGMNFYHFIYLMEYAFILLIMAMSSILLDRYFSMYKQIAKMNINLEEEVVARTEELKAAMDEMEKINETLTSTNQALEESQVTINRDMKMASNVQKKMMCHGMPVLQGWDIHVVYKPMSAVSGDFYDFYLLEETFGGVSLFDVSGHGVSSGLITLLAKSFAYRAFYSEVNKGLHDIISQFQKTILQEIREVDHYLSGIMLKVKEVRQESVVMEYVNAGHPCIIKKDRDTGKAFYLSGGTVLAGVPLGLDGIESGYDVLDVTIEKGDSLFLYTDGLKEQMNKEGGSFGEKGIVASLEQASGSSQEILEGVLRDFDDFRGNEPMGDDLTTIVITRV
jgi:phosphoserine phosphatase RsbU/P